MNLFGDELVSKIAGIRSKIKEHLRYSEDEVDTIVRIGCANSGSSRSAIAATSETVFRPIHRKTVHLWRWRCYYTMDWLNTKITKDYLLKKILCLVIRFDVSPFRLFLSRMHYFP